jgi:2-dehydro-3-deoxygluconokinase
LTRAVPETGKLVAFGEILLRMSPPGRHILLQTPRLDVFVGGAEANVATALARLGHPAAMVSAVPGNALGDHAITTLRGHGVDVCGIRRGRGRMGTYFVASGAGQRATKLIYDRAYSSFAEAPADFWDWDRILDGAGRLHLSGITPALGPTSELASLRAAEAAIRLGVPISFDCNYRSSLWQQREGEPGAILSRLVDKADILFAGSRDIALLLGPGAVPDGDDRAAVDAAFAAFPRLRLVASTTRHVQDAGTYRIAARISDRSETVQTNELAVVGVVDRIGTGDAFAAGVLHAIRLGHDLGEAVETGLTLMALKHTLPGDLSLFDREDLDLATSRQLDVKR